MSKHKRGLGGRWVADGERGGGVAQWKEQTWQQRRLQQNASNNSNNNNREQQQQGKKRQKQQQRFLCGRRVNAAQNIIQKTLTHFSYAAHTHKHTRAQIQSTLTHTDTDTDSPRDGFDRNSPLPALLPQPLPASPSQRAARGGGQLNVDLYNSVFLYINVSVYTRKKKAYLTRKKSICKVKRFLNIIEFLRYQIYYVLFVLVNVYRNKNITWIHYKIILISSIVTRGL